MISRSHTTVEKVTRTIGCARNNMVGKMCSITTNLNCDTIMIIVNLKDALIVIIGGLVNVILGGPVSVIIGPLISATIEARLIVIIGDLVNVIIGVHLIETTGGLLETKVARGHGYSVGVTTIPEKCAITTEDTPAMCGTADRTSPRVVVTCKLDSIQILGIKVPEGQITLQK